jgi:hypothetical protein
MSLKCFIENQAKGGGTLSAACDSLNTGKGQKLLRPCYLAVCATGARQSASIGHLAFVLEPHPTHTREYDEGFKGGGGEKSGPVLQAVCKGTLANGEACNYRGSVNYAAADRPDNVLRSAIRHYRDHHAKLKPVGLCHATVTFPSSSRNKLLSALPRTHVGVNEQSRTVTERLRRKPKAVAARDDRSTWVLQLHAHFDGALKGRGDTGLRCKTCPGQRPFTIAEKDTYDTVRGRIQQHMDCDRHKEVLKHAKLNIFGVVSASGPASSVRVRRHQIDALCFGYTQETVCVEGATIGIKPFLDSTYPYEQWSSNPRVVNSFETSHGEPFVRTGTFLSKDCGGYAVDYFGTPLGGNCCAKCHSVVRSHDFIRAATRHLARASGDASTNGLRRALWTPRCWESELKKVKSACTAELRALSTRSKAGIMTEQEKWATNTAKGDAKAVIGDLNELVDAGKLDESCTWWHVFKNSLRNTKLKNIAEKGLRESRQNRYDDETWDFIIANEIVGGPKANRVLRNFQGPSRSQRAQKMASRRKTLHPGIDDRNFIWLADVWNELRTKHEIPLGEWIACTLEEDETAILEHVQWCPRRDIVYGVCGEHPYEVGRKTKHTCNHDYVVELGDDEGTYDKLVKAVTEDGHGNYLRIVLIQPMHPKMPCFIVMAQNVCLRFGAKEVNLQWKLLQGCFDRRIKHQAKMYMASHGSDGASTRFTLQEWRSNMAHMGRLLKNHLPFKHPHAVVSISGWLEPCSSHPEGYLPAALDASDLRHGIKLAGGRLDGEGALLSTGKYYATFAHLEYANELYSPKLTGCYPVDIERKDRQNFATWGRLCGKNMRKCLRDMQSRTDEHRTDTQGTVAFLDMLAEIHLMHFSINDTIGDRAENAAAALDTLRLWRMGVRATPNQNLRVHFFTRETFKHLTLEIQHSINQIEAARRFSPKVSLFSSNVIPTRGNGWGRLCFYCPALCIIISYLATYAVPLWCISCHHTNPFGFLNVSRQVPLDLASRGSNECEHSFRNIAGFGLTNNQCREVTMIGAINQIEKHNTLLHIESKGQINVSNQGRHKQEFERQHFEDTKAPPADLALHPSVEEVSKRLDAGCATARARIESLGMKEVIVLKYGQDGWDKPQKFDRSWSDEMKVADKWDNLGRDVDPSLMAEADAVESEDDESSTPKDEGSPCTTNNWEDHDPEMAMAMANSEQRNDNQQPGFDYGGTVDVPPVNDQNPHPFDREIPAEEAVAVDDAEVLIVLMNEVRDSIAAAERPASMYKISMTCATPEGRYHKGSLTAGLVKTVLKGKKKMDYTRLRRILANGYRDIEKKKAEEAMCAEGDLSSIEQAMEYLQRQDVVALAFEGTGQDSVWLMKVCRLHWHTTVTNARTSKSRVVRKEAKKPVPLHLPTTKNIWMIGTWFTPVAGKVNEYTLNEDATATMATANIAYPMSVYLGHADMGFNLEADTFELRDPTQMERFINDAKEVQPSTTQNRTVREVHDRIEALANRQNSNWVQRPAEGSYVNRYGRETTTRGE